MCLDMPDVRLIRLRDLPKRSHQHSSARADSADSLFPFPASFRSFRLSLALAVWLLAVSQVFAASLSEAEQLFQAGKYAECIALTGKEIEDGDFSETWRELRIKSQLELGRYAEALKSLEEGLKRYPQSIRLRWLGREVLRSNGRSKEASALIADIGKRSETSPYLYRNAIDSVIIGRYYLEQGEDAKSVLDRVYKKIQKEQPTLTEGFTAVGELALEKQDFGLAAANYEKALKLDPNDPDIHYALARAYASSDSEKSESALKEALRLNPRHSPSLLFVVDGHIDAERYEEAETLLNQVEETNPKHPLAFAYRAVLAHLRHQPQKEQKARAEALSTWKDNPDVDHLIGRKLSQKYRFAEGEVYQRRALVFDPEHLPARLQLCQDLLRLGKEAEGWKLAEEVFEADPYSVVAHNLSTLRDRLNEFTILMDEGFVVRMDAKEAKIYGPRALELLKEAKQKLAARFETELPEPIYVDIYPRQQDFAIRTFGLPGGAGFLGVCFGQVITMNSPASQGANPSNWEAVLWHEFCHVVTLSKTKNRMPRWLSEGISVYEESLRNPSWGQPLTLNFREMILDGEASPVSQLSGAFLHPKSALHLQFAYFESAMVVEYLVDKHGLPALNAILDDLGRGLTINDSLQRHTGSLEALDQEFAAFLKAKAESVAKDADFTDPEFPRTATEETVKAYLKEHPNNFPALQKYIRLLLAAKKWEEAKAPLQQLYELHPGYIGSDSALNLLGLVHRELGETDRERDVLSRVAELEDDVVDVYLRLAEIALEKQDWPAVIRHARQALAVNPLIKTPHEYLTQAAEKLGSDSQAIGSLLALAEMDPVDPAGLSYRTAVLYERTGQRPEARRQLVKALEEAPRYRAAHRLLLELVEQQTPSAPSPAIAEKQP